MEPVKMGCTANKPSNKKNGGEGEGGVGISG